jgi:uncharacterized protein (DUF983 family)
MTFRSAETLEDVILEFSCKHTPKRGAWWHPPRFGAAQKIKGHCGEGDMKAVWIQSADYCMSVCPASYSKRSAERFPATAL